MNETLTSIEETTWIGLQVGILEEVGIEGEDGNITRYENQTGCYWPDGVRPRVAKDDPCPEIAVERVQHYVQRHLSRTVGGRQVVRRRGIERLLVTR